MDAIALSYASGVSATPLLGETIGANLERAAAREIEEYLHTPPTWPMCR
jgi:hypothetical protein